ncbi:MAG TPA: TlpA disulfide reductase family protein [Terriglobales bacterium]|nr:TlpA disulfide reductase family protein [Terriglobales bacterium]
MKRDPLVIVAVAVTIALMLVVGLRMRRQQNPTSTSLKGALAPDFALSSLEGNTVHLSDYRGRAVLLNFWATWCGPCKVEMPWFVELQKQYGPAGLQILGVAMDDSSPGEIAKFAKEMGVNYPVLIGKETVGDAYGGVEFLPYSFYIDRNGKVLDIAFGLRGRGEIEDGVKKILGSSATVQAQK